MSGVGFWELIILLLIGLIVLGPERLPRVANQLGTWIGQARRMTRVMKRQLEEELNFEGEPSIRPARLSTPPPMQTQTTRKEPDDTYSPAHAPGSVGTGADTDVKAEVSAGNAPESVAEDTDTGEAPPPSKAAPDDEPGTQKSQ
jgi:sec-independent protein translocase protein TatB